ncbi:MAG: 50S ribosomal protein L10 [Alphaproteobacteria bacterium]|nr:50S ribosomal protein L10 [Alphaproteobacteria bacterium]
MNRTEKSALVGELNHTFAESAVVVVTRQSGMTVAEASDLRTKMREAGARYKVTKNRLARLALKGTQYEALDDLFTGTTAIATSQDPVAAAKVAVEFAKKNDKIEIIGGALGEKVMDAKGVEALAKLPSIDELRSKLVGVIVAPATKVAGVLNAAPTKVARVLQARAEQEG